MRPLSASEKRFLAKVRRRRANGMRWHEIAAELNMPLATAYQKYQRLEFKEMKLACAPDIDNHTQAA